LVGEEEGVNVFVAAELSRIGRRANSHEAAARARAGQVVTGADHDERDSVRQQLISYRKLCRGSSASVVGGGFGGGADVRALHASMEVAQARVNSQVNISTREVVR